VSERNPEVRRRRASVVVISFGASDAVEGYRRRLALPFSVAVDPERRAYQAYGMLPGSFWRTWHPRAMWRYVVLALRGLQIRRPAWGDDLSQLGGDFVIGPDGLLRFVHVSQRPDDRPEVERLIQALPEAP